ncbi:hypothetical protein PT202_16730, partial [Klebsiella pneumoniae]
GSTGYTALNYRGGYGNANVGYSRSDGFKQLYYGVSGGGGGGPPPPPTRHNKPHSNVNVVEFVENRS